MYCWDVQQRDCVCDMPFGLLLWGFSIYAHAVSEWPIVSAGGPIFSRMRGRRYWQSIGKARFKCYADG